MRIFTHENPDIDAIASLWAALAFAPGAARAPYYFVSAGWDGRDARRDDLILDIDAGGRGIKGERDGNGNTGSSFALVVRKYASAVDQAVLKPLVDFIDVHDQAGRDTIYALTGGLHPDMERALGAVCLPTILRGMRRRWQHDDVRIAQAIMEIIEMLYLELRAQYEARIRAEKAHTYGPKGEVALNINGNSGTSEALFQAGCELVVWVSGDHIGIETRPRPHIRADHPMILEVIEAAGELSEWFFHSAGFTASRGSAKNPLQGKGPSKVRPRDLARAAERAFRAAAMPIAPMGEADHDAANDHMRS